MRILIDTNIIIPLEDIEVDLDNKLAELYRLCKEKNVLLLIHPGTIEDINRDKNQERKIKSLEKLKKYSRLEAYPDFNDGEEERLFGIPKKENDRIDNLILMALYKNSVSFVITEDNGIHKKATKLGVDGQVLFVNQALIKLQKLFQIIDIKLPFIEEKYLHQIDVQQKFFDSLKVGYNEFVEWYTNGQREGRKAWVYYDNDILGGMIIFKEENDPILTDDNIGYPGKVLKLCTFKVNEIYRGNKIGELLLKKALFYAEENSYDGLYLTIRKKTNEMLQKLLADFGFYYFGYRTRFNGEIEEIYCKDQKVKDFQLNSFDFSKKYFPKIKVEKNIKSYIVPIKPIYHNILFPEANRQEELFREMKIAGNAIKQAYLCKSNIKSISKGDLLLFYRSSDLKAITTIGVVESVFRTNNYETILKNVLKRTVYTEIELQQIAQSNTLVILFRTHGHFPKFLYYNYLRMSKILNGPLQSIKSANYEELKGIIDESSFKYSTVIN